MPYIHTYIRGYPKIKTHVLYLYDGLLQKQTGYDREYRVIQDALRRREVRGLPFRGNSPWLQVDGAPRTRAQGNQLLWVVMIMRLGY